MIDEIVKDVGHEVVHIPPYHCELNPSEIVWAHMKGYIRVHNNKFTPTHLKGLTLAGFAHGTTRTK